MKVAGRSPKVAVVGHVEWADFAVVDKLPRAGEIVHASEAWSQAAGGGAVSAVQIAKLAGDCLFFTALGEDSLGDRAESELGRLGVGVRSARRSEPQRRAFVHLERDGERTITTIGNRLAPRGTDELGWESLNDVDAVYVTAGDAAAVRQARQARAVVATTRAAGGLLAAGIPIDALLASRNDPGELVNLGDFDVVPRALVLTDGRRGGTIERSNGETSAWRPRELAGERVDSYGAGDSFAGGLTYGLARGLPLNDAVALGALCGAKNVTGRGPYSGQATARDVENLGAG